MTNDNSASELIVNLMSANLAHTHDVTNRVIDNLEKEVIYQRALNTAIRWKIENLIGGDFMPTPSVIQAALYPGDFIVDRFKSDTAYET